MNGKWFYPSLCGSLGFLAFVEQPWDEMWQRIIVVALSMLFMGSMQALFCFTKLQRGRRK